jgi:hypothetical protein
VSRTSIPTCPREEVIRVILLKADECAFGVVLVLLVWPILSAPMMFMGAVSTQVGPTSRIVQKLVPVAPLISTRLVTLDKAARTGAQWGVDDPTLMVSAAAAVTKHLTFGITHSVTYGASRTRNRIPCLVASGEDS